MTWNIAHPDSPDQILLWAQAIVVWMMSLYGPWGEPVGQEAVCSLSPPDRKGWHQLFAARSIVSGLIVLLIPGLTTVGLPVRLLLAIVTVGFLYGAPAVRFALAQSPSGFRWLAEFEVSINAAFLSLSAVIVGNSDLVIADPLVTVNVAESHLALSGIFIAAVFLAAGGGTFFVRGILDKTGSVPVQTPATSPAAAQPVAGTPDTQAQNVEELDTAEFNRGRLIGVIERILLLLIVIVDGYGALGFLIAAKGLIRIKQFEDRDFAEYFLIGTLTSVLIAVSLGAAVTYMRQVLP